MTTAGAKSAAAGKRALSAATLLLAGLLTGCALEAAPSPPSLRIPTPVKDLTATRAGDAVTLRWTMPKRTTDKALLKGPQPVVVCRAVLPVAPDAACRPIATLHFAPGQAASWTHTLPLALLAGTPRLLAYSVQLYSPWKKTAGPSNVADVVAGMPPPPVGPLRLTTRKDGIVMHWQPAPPEPHMVMRIHRKLVALPHAEQPRSSTGNMAGEGPAPKQVLEISLSRRDPGQAIDRDAALNHTYTYVLQRVLELKVNGAAAELPGAPSQPVTVDARNLFAPAAPRDLEAVADASARAIDLSWQPSPESDVIGYAVYRRIAGSSGAWQRISPAKPVLAAPAWHDAGVEPGVPYEYAVTAISSNGLASPRSAPVREALPAQ
jgi:hypothetical protein